jgi:phosphoserine phosphatase
MTKLHVFDMDGTLLAGSACLEISKHVGAIDAVNDIELRWGRGEVGHVEFYDLCIPLWTGLKPSDIDEVFRVTPWIDGIASVFADISKRGEHSAVVSLSPQFFVDRLLDWGLSTAHGARVQAGEEVDAALVLTPDSKVSILADLMQEYGVEDQDCVAYGDSSSDLPLFAYLSNTVSVNGTQPLRKVAARHYEGTDLWEAYQLGRSLIDGNRIGHRRGERIGEAAQT